MSTLAKLYFLAEAVSARAALEFGDASQKQAIQDQIDASQNMTDTIDDIPNLFPALVGDRTEATLEAEATTLKASLATAVDTVLDSKKKLFAAAAKLQDLLGANEAQAASITALGDAFLARCPNNEDQVAGEGAAYQADLAALYAQVGDLKTKHSVCSATMTSTFEAFYTMFAAAENVFLPIKTGYTKLYTPDTPVSETAGNEILVNLAKVACVAPVAVPSA